MNTKILVVEDQFVEANNLLEILQLAGYKVCPIARSVDVAIPIIERERPDLVLVDIYLQGDRTGIDLAQYLREREIAFVFVSANSNQQILDAAKKTRPYGFLVKPFRQKDVLVMLDIAWYLHRQEKEAANRKRQSDASGKAEDACRHIIGISRNMAEVVDHIRVVGPTDTSVLILGESGTGKELVARAIHGCSPRREKPMVIINCGALPENLIESELFGHEKGAFTNAAFKKIGKFELAEGGTIFLDEIGELPLEAQVKMLRVLQEHEVEPIGGRLKKVDVRVIAATNRNLEAEIAAGRFRLDLYYRLNVFPIEMPPLRERKADILSLANHFLKVFAARHGKHVGEYSPEVVKQLLEYSWPGNVRELENLIERTVVVCKGTVIDSIVLPKAPKTKNDTGIPKTMEENERDHILSVLEQCNWKLHGTGGAAELLDINESTLRSRMKKLGIQKSYIGR
ncbi:MAG TPA: sigma-54 dependent transcriptional regulator [Puia sp.]|uniref:sigma-54-dependent transcriptional regulator n=1 Tax=Puia sp. TaxID=2045100 RepID=UPI002BCFC8EF|nr:sigma-54 dependent transcriptional regulator [Puia sp.]HVU94484.1 sigma-54 dependent transcriptional regulator [Puia sp.]